MAHVDRKRGAWELGESGSIEERAKDEFVNERRIRTEVADPAGGDLRRAALAALAALVAAVAMLASPGPARAALYKWVDEKGVVHYSDTLPPEAVDKARTELNKQGVEVKKTDKALTPEQRRAIEQEAQRQKQLARQQEED